jgi:hypothetical protein
MSRPASNEAVNWLGRVSLALVVGLVVVVALLVGSSMMLRAKVPSAGIAEIQVNP